MNGVIDKRAWSSTLLNKSGEYVHPFVVRVNNRQASYNTLIAHDYISNDHSPAQFIPETLHVAAGYYDSDYNFQDKKDLKEGVDYTVDWNESYTDFKVTIKNASTRTASNGKPAAYEITYQTTAPADGTKIANSVEVKGDEVPLTVNTDKKITTITEVRNSQVTSGGVIQLETGYRITLYKVDEKTQNRLAGAKFKSPHLLVLLKLKRLL